MTRINAGIPPAELTREHLMAEHREIKRVPNKIRKRLEEGKEINFKGQPDKFKLGTGHEKFFYDKLLYLKRRYEALYYECTVVRKYNMTYFGDAWNGIPDEYMNDYEPTDEDRAIVRARIKERLEGK
jgi:hypothetical protein